MLWGTVWLFTFFWSRRQAQIAGGKDFEWPLASQISGSGTDPRFENYNFAAHRMKIIYTVRWDRKEGTSGSNDFFILFLVYLRAAMNSDLCWILFSPYLAMSSFSIISFFWHSYVAWMPRIGGWVPIGIRPLSYLGGKGLHEYGAIVVVCELHTIYLVYFLVVWRTSADVIVVVVCVLSFFPWRCIIK